MYLSYRIEGYAIVSSNGMIADAQGAMPDTLKLEADQRFFEHAMESVDAVVHGRRSHEGHPNSHLRRRIILTRKIAAIAPDPENPGNPNYLLWNAEGASFAEVCTAIGLESGTIAVLGGPEAYGMFLDIGYDAFHLTCAGKVTLPDGMPVFSQTRPGQSPEELMAQFGLEPGPLQVLDESNAVTLVTWRPSTTVAYSV